MVDEKLQKKIWKYCPAFLVWIAGAVMVLKAEISDIPINDGFYISSEIQIVGILAALWVAIFLSWGFWLKHSPKFYRDEVFSDVRDARDIVGDAMAQIKYQADKNYKYQYLLSIKNGVEGAKRMPTVALRLELIKVLEKFRIAISEEEEAAFENLKVEAISSAEIFYRNTDWVLKK